MRSSHFPHTATIARPTHTLAGRKKVLDETTVATGVACRIQPLVEATNESVLGIGTADTYQGYFPDGTDIQTRDVVSWSTFSPALVLVAESVILHRDRNDRGRVHECILKRRDT